MFIKSENICLGCKNLQTLQAFLIFKEMPTGVFCQKMLILFSKILCYTEFGHRLIRKGCWKWDSLQSVMIFLETIL